MGGGASRSVRVDLHDRPLEDISIKQIMKRCEKISKRLSLKRYIDIRVSIQNAKSKGYYARWLNEYENSGLREGSWYSFLSTKITNISRPFQIGKRLCEKELIDYARVRQYKKALNNIVW